MMPYDTAEFAGAVSAGNNMPDLTIDTMKTLLMGQYGLNKVEVFRRNNDNLEGNYVGLYEYHATLPDTMLNFEGMPIAERYYPNHHVFKTSYFSFPLLMMDNSDGQVQDIFTNMLEWFLGDGN